jgi:hypothetical protein
VLKVEVDRPPVRSFLADQAEAYVAASFGFSFFFRLARVGSLQHAECRLIVGQLSLAPAPFFVL